MVWGPPSSIWLAIVGAQERTVDNDKRGALLDEMGALDPAQLVARPLAGKWSMLEIASRSLPINYQADGVCETEGPAAERQS